MNIVVVYNSKTGFSEKYAKWIAEELDCKAVSKKEFFKSEEVYDLVIYGQGLMGGKLMGLDKIKQRCAGKKLVVFATGATPMDQKEMIEKMPSDNLTKEEQADIKFYYFEGGIQFERLGFFPKAMLNMMKKSIEKKEEKTADDENMLKIFASSSDHSKKEYIIPLVEYVKGL